jgi:hypothetical protein
LIVADAIFTSRQTLDPSTSGAGNSWGKWETKDGFIKDLQSKAIKWKSGNLSDLKVATFGSNTAVSHYTFTYDADFKGTHRARTVICSDTLVNDSGTWRLLRLTARW